MAEYVVTMPVSLALSVIVVADNPEDAKKKVTQADVRLNPDHTDNDEIYGFEVEEWEMQNFNTSHGNVNYSILSEPEVEEL